MTEIWKDVKKYEGLYRISSIGRLKRVYKNKLEKILKPIKGHLGYINYTLSKDGKIKTFRIHRLVAEHFIANPLNLPEVNHIDSNKGNYSIDNLEWCTRSTNMKHAYSNGLIDIHKARQVLTKLNPAQIKIVKRMKEVGFTLNEISIISNISISRLSTIINKSQITEENIK